MRRIGRVLKGWGGIVSRCAPPIARPACHGWRFSSFRGNDQGWIESQSLPTQTIRFRTARFGTGRYSQKPLTHLRVASQSAARSFFSATAVSGGGPGGVCLPAETRPVRPLHEWRDTVSRGNDQNWPPHYGLPAKPFTAEQLALALEQALKGRRNKSTVASQPQSLFEPLSARGVDQQAGRRCSSLWARRSRIIGHSLGRFSAMGGLVLILDHRIGASSP